MKKTSAGFILPMIAVLLTAASGAAYLLNCRTTYFATFGISAALLACLAAGIAAHLLSLLCGRKGSRIWTDVFPVAAAAILMAAAVQFIGLRINEIAFILTFQKNADTLADMKSAVIGIGLCLSAVIVSWAAAFFDPAGKAR